MDSLRRAGGRGRSLRDHLDARLRGEADPAPRALGDRGAHLERRPLHGSAGQACFDCLLFFACSRVFEGVVVILQRFHVFW